MKPLHRFGLSAAVALLLGTIPAVAGPTPGNDGALASAPDSTALRDWREAPLLAGGARPYWKRNLFRRLVEDQKFLVTEWWPAESRRWGFSVPMLASVAGATGSVTGGVDLRWQRSMEHWTRDGRSGVAETITRLGDRDTGIVLLGSAYLITRWTGNERGRRVTTLSMEALLNAGLYSELLKRATGRTRPSGGGRGEFFVTSPGAQQINSFPSGHTTGVFAVASVVASEFRDRRWVPWAVYGTAGLVGLSRVGLGRHFPSDVLAGAVLGHSLGSMVVQRSGGEELGGKWSRLKPFFEPAGGVGVAYRHGW